MLNLEVSSENHIDTRVRSHSQVRPKQRRPFLDAVEAFREEEASDAEEEDEEEEEVLSLSRWGASLPHEPEGCNRSLMSIQSSRLQRGSAVSFRGLCKRRSMRILSIQYLSTSISMSPSISSLYVSIYMDMYIYIYVYIYMHI